MWQGARVAMAAGSRVWPTVSGVGRTWASLGRQAGSEDGFHSEESRSVQEGRGHTL